MARFSYSIYYTLLSRKFHLFNLFTNFYQTISNEKTWNKLQKSKLKFPNQVVYEGNQFDYLGKFFLNQKN